MFHMQRQRKLNEEHARFYAAEICLALNFLHERGKKKKLKIVWMTIQQRTKRTLPLTSKQRNTKKDNI